MGRGSALLLALLWALGCETTLDLVRADVPDASCGAATCNGCCDGSTCVTGSGDQACGSAGAQCIECVNGQHCVDASCSGSTIDCGTASCNGCCNVLLMCLAGTENSQCGKGGNPCATCGNSQVCDNGVCGACGPSNCTGCCGDIGTCWGGSDDVNCGTGGMACAFCDVTHCVGGKCQ